MLLCTGCFAQDTRTIVRNERVALRIYLRSSSRKSCLLILKKLAQTLLCLYHKGKLTIEIFIGQQSV